MWQISETSPRMRPGAWFCMLRVWFCILLLALTGCGAGDGGTKGSTTTSTTGTTTSQGTVTFAVVKSSDLSTSTTSVSQDSPAVIRATAKDGTGAAVAGKVMTFTSTFDITFSPSSGTVLTDANGMAAIKVMAGNTTGAAIITVSVTASDGTAISGNIGLTVGPPNLSLSALTITPTTLSAGGSAGVSVTVLDSAGNPYTTPVPVTFTSSGVGVGKATITAQAYTVNGVASATYKDINYAAVDTITASLVIGGTTFTKTGQITVNPASAGSIAFVSATPTNIALKGTGGAGRSETSVVVFQVLDNTGHVIAGTRVNFSLIANTSAGGLALTATSAFSDGTGLAQTIVQAGTVSTPVRVSATINGTSITTVSDQLVVSTGIPDQDSFSISASKLNFECWNYDGETTDINVRLADHYNNNAPNGTAVSFWTSGAAVQPSCTTTDGACKVTLTSQNPRPANGRIVVLGFALGEESFTDINGNGKYDPALALEAASWTDMPEPFLDKDEDTIRGAAEPFVDTNNDGVYSPGDGIFNGILRDSSIVGPTTIDVRQLITIVCSGSNAVISVLQNVAPFNPLNPIPLTPCTTGGLFNNAPVTFGVKVTDVNGNMMPVGTTISFSTTNGTIVSTPTSYTVPNSTALVPPTYSVTMESDATQSGAAAPYTCTNTRTAGAFEVKVTTPKGVTTYSHTTVTD